MTFICLCIFHLDTLFSDWSTSPSLILLPSYYGPASFGLTKRFLSRLFIVNNLFIVMTSCPIPALFKYVQRIVIVFINVIVLSVLVSNCRMKLSISVNIQIMYTYTLFFVDQNSLHVEMHYKNRYFDSWNRLSNNE